MNESDVESMVYLTRSAGAVKRYHAARTLRTQDIAAHSWGVATLVLCVHPEPSAALLTAALLHDIAEIETGDVPATAKWKSQKLCDALTEMETQFELLHKIPTGGDILTDAEKHILRWCDLAELVYWTIEEYSLGNMYSIPILTRGVRALREMGPPTTAAAELQDQIFIHEEQICGS